MSKKKILVVDDMAFIRKVLTEIINNDPLLEVIGTAGDGKIALSQLEALKPDAVVLDIEMPEMNGLETLKAIRAINKDIPVIMFSSLTEQGAKITLDALTFGASDYVPKPANMANYEAAKEYLNRTLISMLKIFTGAVATIPMPESISKATSETQSSQKVEIVVVGVSTGGPNALMDFLPQLGLEISVPLLIVLHMPAAFTSLFAARMSTGTTIPVVEAKDGDEIIKNKIYLAPGGYHMKIINDGVRRRIALDQGPEENFCRPAVDPLFRSAAEIYGAGVLGVVLTGMGQDGMAGASAIRLKGGQILAQDEKSSAVWGMPGAVVTANLAQGVYSLSEIGTEVSRLSWIGKR